MKNKTFALTILITGFICFACEGDNRQAQIPNSRDADGIAADQTKEGQARDNQPTPATHTKDTTGSRPDDGLVGDSQPTSASRTEDMTGAQPNGDHVRENQAAPTPRAQVAAGQKVSTPKVTFVELGSVNCIPCKAMQPVMHSIAKKYGEQIKVIFYDVWTAEQQHYARDFNIRVIPTQVFLDQNGKEILRHQGFFAEEDIDRFLQAQGLKVLYGV